MICTAVSSDLVSTATPQRSFVWLISNYIQLVPCGKKNLSKKGPIVGHGLCEYL